MAQFLKPSNLNNVWASGGDRIYPGDTKYATGWQVEIPPRQYFNEIDYKQDQMLAHINQRGIAEWDAETEYQANKSYTQDSTGTIHRCILTHTGQNPELDVSNTYWEIAFAAAGDFYTKAEVDADFLAKDQNLGDLLSVTDARTNLSVYSKAETYTKTEVDGKTTVASALQAQQQTSNTVLLSPARLADAFKGANFLGNPDGYLKLPGGVILQWARGVPTTVGDSTQVINFPIPFQTAALQVIPSTIAGGTVTSDLWAQVISATTSSATVVMQWTGVGSAASGATPQIFAIGY